jgi:hypothetical protein
MFYVNFYMSWCYIIMICWYTTTSMLKLLLEIIWFYRDKSRVNTNGTKTSLIYN